LAAEAPGGGSLVMMLTGGIELELGKSPDIGRPVGIDAVGAAGAAAGAGAVPLPQLSA
jgi:hypothetical protein